MALLSLAPALSLADNNIYGPPNSGGAVIVKVGFYLNNINRISEEDETIEFESVLTMQWQDERLAFDPETEGVDQKFYQGDYQFSELFSGWWPQVYLANESGLYERQGIVVRLQPDGSVLYREEIDGIAESRMDLKRFPFDKQRFVLTFEALGLDTSHLILKADPSTSGLWNNEQHEIRIPQWRNPRLELEDKTYHRMYSDLHDPELTAVNVIIDVDRDPGYMLRLVVLPVMIFVILSWSVFWMDRSSLGDRMDISFIGILTIVAYQIMFSESLPKISYITVLMSFMIVSFLMMCASVVINLWVAWNDQKGRRDVGDRIDFGCRYIFPLVYVSGCLLFGGYVYLNG